MFLKLSNPFSQCNLKFAGEAGEFEGYASAFNSNDAVNDTVAKGAFIESLFKSIPAMFINHDHKSVPVGDWVEAKEDDFGLYVVGKIDMNHKDGPTVYSAMKRKAMSGLSIGFTMGKSDYTLKDDGGRLINKANLKEVSIVTFPCEDLARISSVKQETWDAIESIKDLERLLREDFGASKSVAVAFLSHAKRILVGEPSNVAEQIKGLENRLVLDNSLKSLSETLGKLTF